MENIKVVTRKKKRRNDGGDKRQIAKKLRNSGEYI